MRCGKCNKRIRRTDAYCPYCSEKVSERERQAAGPTLKEKFVEQVERVSLPALPRVPAGWALWAGGLVFLGLVLWGLSGSHDGVDQQDLRQARISAYEKGRQDGLSQGKEKGIDYVFNTGPGSDPFQAGVPYVITFYETPQGSQMKTYLQLEPGRSFSCDSEGQCTGY